MESVLISISYNKNNDPKINYHNYDNIHCYTVFQQKNKVLKNSQMKK